VGVAVSFKYGLITLRRLLIEGLGWAGTMFESLALLNWGRGTGARAPSATDFFLRRKNEDFLPRVGAGAVCSSLGVAGTGVGGLGRVFD